MKKQLSLFKYVVSFTVFFLLSGYFYLSADSLSLKGRLDPFNQEKRYADVWGEGNYAYVGSYNGRGVMIFDISRPEKPKLAGHYTPAYGGRFQDVVVKDGIGFFSSENDGGVHIVDVRNPAKPVLLSRVSPAIDGYPNVHEIFVEKGVLYEADFRTPVVKAFDVRDPRNPVLLWDITTSDSVRVHACVVIGGRLYTSGWGGITDVFDVGKILTRYPAHLASINTGAASHSCWASPDGRLLASARETLNGDVRLYDISNLKNPRLLSSVTAEDLGLSAFSAHNPYIVGNLLFVSWYQAGLVVVDISNPRRPRLLGSYDTYPASESWALLVHDEGEDKLRGCWGVFPFLGLQRILLSDTDNGLFIVDVRK